MFNKKTPIPECLHRIDIEKDVAVHLGLDRVTIYYSLYIDEGRTFVVGTLYGNKRGKPYKPKRSELFEVYKSYNGLHKLLLDPKAYSIPTKLLNEMKIHLGVKDAN